jgi:superfamily II DNA or RNA helicase
MMSYSEFLKSKAVIDQPSGFTPRVLNSGLFPFQSDIVKWALRRGRAAIFADTGLGKTLMQLVWAEKVAKKTRGNVLILAPLAVSTQTVREGERFGIDASYCRSQDDVASGITITNYEMLHAFDPGKFQGIVLDESSILKAYDGKTRTRIIEAFSDTPYRLACTATPAPNDFMELGNHAEFLGAMTRSEMLAMFFINDGSTTQAWRLKGHAQRDFWKWLCSWAVMIRKPSDLGYDDDGFILPPLRVCEVVVDVPADRALPGMLFPMDAVTLRERQEERRQSTPERAATCAKLVNRSDDPWIVWCNLNTESEQVAAAIPGAVEVRGSHKHEFKEQAMLGFAAGEFRVLVTKPSIAGFGMNWQHCNNVAFLGLSDSWESYYQAVRRCWRFGQKKPVDCHIITASTEGAVVRNIKRKEEAAETMATEMITHTQDITKNNIKGTVRETTELETAVESGELWEMRLGDCIDEVAKIETDSIGYTIFSPPFASLYTYSNSDRDMGNCKTHDTFSEHFAFLIPELLRVTQPGRLLSFHCMNLPTSKVRDGVIGIVDFRGMLIRAFTEAGWIYHSEVCIWKDPVTAMQRTKALGLLYKQLRKDSCMSRQGIPDFIVTMRKPGDNQNRVTKTHEGFPVAVWQRYASPVWTDINQSNTLQRTSAREDKDEKHICPLQLDVIERCIDLWTNEDDLVLSPFAGIGSEGYVAVKKKRRFVGFELKKSYWTQACANLREAAEETTTQLALFAR